MYYVYILKLSNHAKHRYYTGNLKRRFKEHQNKNEKVELIYYESYQVESLARIRESKLKQYGSTWRGLKRRLNLA